MSCYLCPASHVLLFMSCYSCSAIQISNSGMLLYSHISQNTLCMSFVQAELVRVLFVYMTGIYSCQQNKCSYILLKLTTVILTLTLTLMTLTPNKIYFDINEKDKQQEIDNMISRYQ